MVWTGHSGLKTIWQSGKQGNWHRFLPSSKDIGHPWKSFLDPVKTLVVVLLYLGDKLTTNSFFFPHKEIILFKHNLEIVKLNFKQ